MAKSHYRDMYMRMPAYRVRPGGRGMYMRVPDLRKGSRHEVRGGLEGAEGPLPPRGVGRKDVTS